MNYLSVYVYTQLGLLKCQKQGSLGNFGNQMRTGGVKRRTSVEQVRKILVEGILSQKWLRAAVNVPTSLKPAPTRYIER